LRHKAFIITLVVLASACSVELGPIDLGSGDVEGSGTIITEQRSVAGFSRVILEGEGRVILDITGSASLEVAADDNLIDYIETEVRGDRLIIETRSGVDIDPSRTPVYRITAEALEGIELAGSARSNWTSGRSKRPASNCRESGTSSVRTSTPTRWRSRSTALET